MFVSNLNKEQQGLLLGLSKMLINADGIVTEEEKLLLDMMKKQCASEVDVLENPLAKIDEISFSYKEKVSFLLEIVGVAYIDSEYQEEEKKLIKTISDKLKISYVLLEDIESWVKRQCIMMQEANTMMGV